MTVNTSELTKTGQNGEAMTRCYSDEMQMIVVMATASRVNSAAAESERRGRVY